jgi:hypothetical protein
MAGNLTVARGHAEQALALYAGVPNRLGQANAHSNIAAVDMVDGGNDRAVRHLEIALALHEELNNFTGAAAVNCQLGDLALSESRPADARSRWAAALAVYAQSGSPEAEGVRERLAGLATLSADDAVRPALALQDHLDR